MKWANFEQWVLQRSHNVIEKVLKENDIDAKLTKVDDIMEMMNYNIMTSPAVVIDEVVKLKGKVPTESEVKELLGIWLTEYV